MIDRRTMLKGIGAATGGALATTVAGPLASADAAQHSARGWSPGPGRTPQHRAFQDPKGARARVFILNDASGDPDGLFATVHALMSTTTQVTGLVGCLNSDDGSATPATDGVAIYNDILRLMGLSGKIPTYSGANKALTGPTTPQPSPGATALVAEAMRTDTTLPLFVTAGCTLTDVASAYLMEPAIAGKFTLVWIGGGPYPNGGREFNLSQDVMAAQVLFQNSTVPIWQITSAAYSQNVVSATELQLNVAPHGAIGAYLYQQYLDRLNGELLNQPVNPNYPNLGETYVLGDSPTVLLTALQGSYGGVNSSDANATFQTVTSPIINSNGTYSPNPSGRPIRAYQTVDSRLIQADFFAKMKLNFG